MTKQKRRDAKYIAIIATLSGCANTSKAEEYAEEYAKTNYPGATISSTQCELGDSDQDGRVRCNISIKTNGRNTVEAVECPAGWLWQPLKTTCVGIKGRW